MSEASKTSVSENFEIAMGIGWKRDPDKPTGWVSATPGEYAAEITRLTAELEIARKALEPFAEIAKEFTGQLSDDRKNTMHWAVPTVGEFRAALRVLQGEQK